MGRLVISLEILWPYPIIFMLLGSIMTTRGDIIVDLPIFTPIMAVTELIIAIQSLIMVTILITFDIIFTLWVVHLYLKSMVQDNIVKSFMLLIYAFPDGLFSLGCIKFHIILIMKMLTCMKIFQAQISCWGLVYTLSVTYMLFF